MTIQLTASILIAGVSQAAGTSLTLGAPMEAELVNRGVAVYTSRALTPGENLTPAQLTTTPSGGVAVLDPSTGGILDDLQLKSKALVDGRFLAGQPFGITRPVRNPGKLVCDFKAADWGAYGLATLSDTYTGYDANGNVTGVVSRTGHPTMLKVVPGDDANEGIVSSNLAVTAYNTALNGKFGLWVYCETQPGYGAGEAGATSLLTVDISTENSFASNYLTVTFQNIHYKEGWNFLVFVMRNPQAYVSGSGVTEYHPAGVYASVTGTGADIVKNPINKLRIYTNGTGITGTNLYFDSMWTGFDTQAQFVLGHDLVDSSVINYSLPIYQSYGWKGYFTVNSNYTGDVIISDYSHTTTFDGYAAQLVAAGWDSINHSLTHIVLGSLTNAAKIAYQVMANWAVMKDMGFSRGTEFYAAPQNSSSRLTEKVISGCGFKLQRVALGRYSAVTPWGLPNPNCIGAVGLGQTGEAVHTTTTSGASSAQSFGAGGIGNLQRAKNMVDIAVAYGSTVFVYAHSLETAGDDGTGNTEPAVATNCIESLNRLFLAYLKIKDDAGLLRVRDGFTGFYYGVGR